MIQTSSAFATANAKLAKRPIWLVKIEGYARAFVGPNASAIVGTTFAGIFPSSAIEWESDFGNIGGLSMFPGTITKPTATPAGNIIYAFMDAGDGGGSPGISDTFGLTWTALYLGVGTVNGAASIWRAVAPPGGIPAGNAYTFVTGANRASTHFYIIEVGADFNGSLHTHTTGSGPPATATTSDGTTLTIGFEPTGCSWDLFLISLKAPSSAQAGIALGLLLRATNGALDDPSQSINTGGGLANDAVVGCQTTAFDYLKSLDDLQLTISDLDGGSDLADLVFNVQDRGQAITGDFPSFVFEGKKCWLLMGYAGMALADFCRLFTGVIDTVESDNQNTEYKFTVPSRNQKKLSASIYTTGDDGFPTDQKHPRTILGHPLDILVSALEQAGVAPADIDTTKIYFYRDTIFNGLLYEFSLTKAPEAKTFIETELMKPLGMYHWENNLGLISINSFYPALSGSGGYTPPTFPAATLDSSVIVDVPNEQQAALVDQVTFRFDNDGSNFNSEIVQSWSAALEKYGLVGAEIIESQGMRAGLQGYFMAAIISRLIFLRYGSKPIVLDPLPLQFRQSTLEPGDLLAVTLAFIADRKAGVMGVTTKAFEVLDRNWRFQSSRVEVKLLEIDLSKFEQFLITPNAEPDYASDTAPNRAKYMYLDDVTGKYSTGAAGNTLG